MTAAARRGAAEVGAGGPHEQVADSVAVQILDRGDGPAQVVPGVVAASLVDQGLPGGGQGEGAEEEQE